MSTDNWISLVAVLFAAVALFLSWRANKNVKEMRLHDLDLEVHDLDLELGAELEKMKKFHRRSLQEERELAVNDWRLGVDYGPDRELMEYVEEQFYGDEQSIKEIEKKKSEIRHTIEFAPMWKNTNKQLTSERLVGYVKDLKSLRSDTIERREYYENRESERRAHWQKTKAEEADNSPTTN